jgi:hypothetical protein
MPHAGKRSARRTRRTAEIEPLADLKALVEALNRSLHDALEVHRRLGHAVPAWRRGRLVWVEPDEMQLDHLLVGVAATRRKRGRS